MEPKLMLMAGYWPFTHIMVLVSISLNNVQIWHMQKLFAILTQPLVINTNKV